MTTPRATYGPFGGVVLWFSLPSGGFKFFPQFLCPPTNTFAVYHKGSQFGDFGGWSHPTLPHSWSPLSQGGCASQKNHSAPGLGFFLPPLTAPRGGEVGDTLLIGAGVVVKLMGLWGCTQDSLTLPVSPQYANRTGDTSWVLASPAFGAVRGGKFFG